MKREVLFGLLFALVVGVFLSPLASTNPDGLERVLEHFGLGHVSAELISSPLPDYTVPGIANGFLSTALAGFLGVLVCFGFTAGIAFLLAKRSRSDGPSKKEA